MIPPSYKPASWHCTLPPEKETGDLAVGFGVGDEVVRLRISSEDARALVETLQGYLDPSISQSPISSGNTGRWESLAIYIILLSISLSATLLAVMLLVMMVLGSPARRANDIQSPLVVSPAAHHQTSTHSQQFQPRRRQPTGIQSLPPGLSVTTSGSAHIASGSFAFQCDGAALA
tara:strand:- start:14177 stop:14701 length:525 start_codon:yes stop_codon:yes gene_type:complete